MLRPYKLSYRLLWLAGPFWRSGENKKDGTEFVLLRESVPSFDLERDCKPRWVRSPPPFFSPHALMRPAM